MKYLLTVNRRRILPFSYLLALCLFLLASSIYFIKKEQNQYLQESFHVEISDGTEYRYLMDRKWYNNEEANRLISKYKLPQEHLAKEEVDIKEFLFVESLNDALLQGKKPAAQGFFDYRMDLIKKTYQDNDIKDLDKIFTGYCEGWKVLLRNFDKIFYTVLVALVLLLLPVMREDDRLKTKNLVEATLYGKKKLFQTRIINGIEIGLFTYLAGVFLFSFLVFLIYGRDGQDLFIQNSKEFFLFPIQVTYLQYFFYKLCNGLVLTLCFIFLFLLLGNLLEDVKLSFSLVLAYVSIHFLLQSLWTSPSSRKFLLLSPLSLINIENFNFSLSYHSLQSYYLDSLIFPLLLSIVLWIGLSLEKKKAFS